MKVKCSKCKTEIVERGSIYCPNCGNFLNPPLFEMETKEVIPIIILLILLLPVGIMVGILKLWSMKNERKEWMHEQDMKRLEQHK